MLLWSSFVEIVRVALFGTAHVFGGSVGAGIFVFSLALRVALLPWTIRAARQMRTQREKLRALKPDLDRLRKRHGRDWRALNAARAALYAKNGLDAAPKGLLASLIQLPFAGAIYRSATNGIRRSTSFLWIRDLTRPDVALATVAAVIAALNARSSAGEQQRVAIVVSAAMTFFFAWRMSASIALYSIAWSGVNAAEAFFIRRTPRT